MTLVPPVSMRVGEKALLRVGGLVTTNVAVFQAGPRARSSVLTPLVMLVCVPAVVLVTTNDTVQPAVGMPMPVNDRLVAPAVSVLGVIPVQVPPTVCAPLTCMPVSVSVKARAVCAVAPGFVRVSVTVAVPPLLICAGAMALLMPISPTPSVAMLEPAPATTVWLLVTPPAVFE